jgi:ATP-binding cassette, subfamily B, bacterial
LATHNSGNAAPERLKVLAQLAVFFKPYRYRILFAFIALTVAACATLALPWMVRIIIDQGFFAEHAATIDRYFLMLFGIVMIIAMFSAARFYLVMWLGERIVADIRIAVYQHVIKMDPIFFEITRTGEVLSRLTTDTTLLQSVVGAGFSIALRMSFMLLGSLIMLTITSPQLTGFILVLVPVVIFPLLIYGRKIRRLSRTTQSHVAEASAIAGETLNAIHTLQAFVLEKFYSDRFAHTITLAFTAGCKRLLARALLSAFAILVVFSAVMGVIWIGTQFVIAEKMSIGELSQFLIYAFIVATSTAALSEVWGDVQKAAGAMERLLELLHSKPSIHTSKHPVPLKIKSTDHLHFEQIVFQYPTRPEQYALKNFTLDVAPGETIALVGPSGAGKSTVLQLLLRFYDPQQGTISLGDIDIAQANIQQLRQQIGIVPQETVIFAADVMENIRIGNLEASYDDILAAAKAAAADQFIRQLPEGFNTFLGERGTRLSGGQRQRIAIARAILKNPPILLLDEATSALDAESEKLVQEAMEHLMQNRTTLVIAHRLATVLKADRILVMNGGQILAIGKHQELITECSLYARLAELQFSVL